MNRRRLNTINSDGVVITLFNVPIRHVPLITDTSARAAVTHGLKLLHALREMSHVETFYDQMRTERRHFCNNDSARCGAEYVLLSHIGGGGSVHPRTHPHVYTQASVVLRHAQEQYNTSCGCTAKAKNSHYR